MDPPRSRRRDCTNDVIELLRSERASRTVDRSTVKTRVSRGIATQVSRLRAVRFGRERPAESDTSLRLAFAECFSPYPERQRKTVPFQFPALFSTFVFFRVRRCLVYIDLIFFERHVNTIVAPFGIFANSTRQSQRAKIQRPSCAFTYAQHTHDRRTERSTRPRGRRLSTGIISSRLLTSL